MARGKGKIYTADFKTKVVLELLEGDQTINQLASKYDVTVKSIQSWKKQFLENASLAFQGNFALLVLMLVEQLKAIKLK